MVNSRNKITSAFTEPICMSCVHLTDGKAFKCKAFPDGIPDEILFGDNDHTKPLPDQKNKIVFEAKK